LIISALEDGLQEPTLPNQRESRIGGISHNPGFRQFYQVAAIPAAIVVIPGWNGGTRT
jgi:hypothetical protein